MRLGPRNAMPSVGSPSPLRPALSRPVQVSAGFQLTRRGSDRCSTGALALASLKGLTRLGEDYLREEAHVLLPLTRRSARRLHLLDRRGLDENSEDSDENVVHEVLIIGVLGSRQLVDDSSVFQRW